MRLFNRRRELEFDDPRLVGMTPLKTTEESSAEANGTDDRSSEGLLTLRRCNTNVNAPPPTAAQQPDKLRMTNAVSTWKRVARPWDSLRRSESSEHLSRSITSSATNRRKTLHFYPDIDGKINEKSLTQYQTPEKICSSDRNESTPVSTPTKRKIGRVESLRLLLTKPNRMMHRGRIVNNTKQDKGTDTIDLENDVENSSPYYHHAAGLLHSDNHHDEVLQSNSKYASLSSLKSESIFSSPSISSGKGLRNRFQMQKTTSCENLNSIRNRNQGITLPGHRDMSTSTSTTFPPFTDCLSPQTTMKRSSFPYAYIRSRLSSLQEEPKTKPLSMSVRSARTTNDPIQKEKQKCSLASNFMHKGFYHSMGNLLSESNSKEEDHPSGSVVDGEFDDEDEGESPVQGVSMIFDPLKQIRIDLLHRNPSESEIDDQSPSPTFWGRRSYSIGDILLEKHKVIGKTDSGNVEESGYDSDSTRNGHESPRNSVKSPSSETENDLNEPEQCVIRENSRILINSERDIQSFDTQSQSASSESSGTSSTSTSMYSFPASGCLITINQISTPREVSVKGFRRTADGTIEEVTSEIDQSEDVDFYSANTEGTLESVSVINNPNNKVQDLAENSFKSSTNVVVNEENTTQSSKNSSERSSMVVNSKGKDAGTTSVVTIRKDEKTAPSLRLRNKFRDRDREWNSIKPHRSKSLCLSIFTISFQKGPEKKSLGFSVIGGKDSPVPGIFVKRIFSYGQAAEHGLTEGDEILSVNGQPLANSTHTEALLIFKSFKAGEIVLEVARREFLPTHNSQTLKRQHSQLNSKSCEQLFQAY